MEKLLCPSCEREFDIGEIRYCPYDGTKLILRSDDTLSGKIFDGRYKILYKISEGGMGSIYKAQQLNTGKEVAIKMISKELTRTEETIKRFRREVELQIKLSHPNIVTVIDFSKTEEGDYYFVMEYLEGKSLKNLIVEKGALPLTEFYDLAYQMCDAMAYAHSKEIIHRDLKPENIIIVPLGYQQLLKIVDFGIAKALQGTGMGNTELTQMGRVIGTPAYMSPEQAKGQIDKISHKSDLYSMGVIFYQMLSGSLPFESDTPWGLMHKHLGETPRPLKEIVPTIPDQLNDIVMKLLEKDPDDRYPSALALKQDLMQAERATSVSLGDSLTPSSIEIEDKTIPSTQSRKKSKGNIIWIGLGIFIIVALSFFIWNFVYIPSRNRNIEEKIKVEIPQKMAEKKESGNATTTIIKKEKQKEIEKLIEKADSLFMQGKLIEPDQENACLYYKKVISLQKNNERALSQLDIIKERLIQQADSLKDEGRLKEAIKAYNKILSFFQDDPVTIKKIEELKNEYILKAKEAISKKRLSQAISFLKELSSIDKNNIKAAGLLSKIKAIYRTEGERLLKIKDYKKALKLLGEAETYFPGEFKNSLKMAKIEVIQSDAEDYLFKKEYEHAAILYKKILKILPDDVRVSNGLQMALIGLEKEGDAAFQKGMYMEALNTYKKIKSIDPSYPNIDSKIEKIKDRDNRDKMLADALSLSYSGNFEEAIKLYQSILTKYPDEDRAREGIEKIYSILESEGDRYINQGEFDLAIKKYEELIRIGGPKDKIEQKIKIAKNKKKEIEINALIDKGDRRAQENRIEEAISFYKKAIALGANKRLVEDKIRKLSYGIKKDAWKEPYLGMEFVWIPGGCFKMGSPQTEATYDPDETPVHDVCVKGFWMSKYEVTNREFVRFLNDVGKRSTDINRPWFETKEEDQDSHIIGEVGKFQVENGYENHPVIEVSWYGAKAFARWIGEKNGKLCRLPSEAEWEYVCRNGKQNSKYPWGETSPCCKKGMINGAKFDDDNLCHATGTEPVGSYKPNAFGVYDMSGNVWEWCEDWYSETYYRKSPRDNPMGPNKGKLRVLRGGSWSSKAWLLRCANRDSIFPTSRNYDFGFRIVCEEKPK